MLAGGRGPLLLCSRPPVRSSLPPPYGGTACQPNAVARWWTSSDLRHLTACDRTQPGWYPAAGPGSGPGRAGRLRAGRARRWWRGGRRRWRRRWTGRARARGRLYGDIDTSLIQLLMVLVAVLAGLGVLN